MRRAYGIAAPTQRITGSSSNPPHKVSCVSRNREVSQFEVVIVLISLDKRENACIGDLLRRRMRSGRCRDAGPDFTASPNLMSCSIEVQSNIRVMNYEVSLNMVAASLVLALLIPAQNDPASDARTVIALLGRYHASFQDVTFLHEGTMVKGGEDTSNSADVIRFQSYYAYRNDGATLLDVFANGRGDRPDTRTVRSILNGRLEIFDASPDYLPPVRDRAPDAGHGGPGSLAGQDSPERIFLAWYFLTLGDPAEHDVEVQGWEEVEGHRCLKVRMLGHPKPLLKGWTGGLPFVKLWIDLERDGYPLRVELYSGDDLEVRTEISRLECHNLPDGRPFWLPAEGSTSTYVGGSSQGGMIRSKEPLYIETHKILKDTVKFNQGLKDDFFSTKRHALVASDEDLRKLQREHPKKPMPPTKSYSSDPESIQKRLDEALAEADRQAQRLETSSAARAGFGWSTALYVGLAVAGLLMLGTGGFRYWRSR